MGETEEKIATMPAWPSLRARKISVMPKAMAMAALPYTNPASRALMGLGERAGFQPVDQVHELHGHGQRPDQYEKQCHTVHVALLN